MEKKEALATVAIFLTTLLECGESPKSPFYITLGMDMQKYQFIESFMVQAGFVTVTPETMTLTAKGTEFAKKCQTALAARK